MERFLRFRSGRGRKLWSELHVSVGLWRLQFKFTFVIVRTSLRYLFEGLRYGVGDGVFDYASHRDRAAVQLPRPPGPDGEPLPLAELVATATAQPIGGLGQAGATFTGFRKLAKAPLSYAPRSCACRHSWLAGASSDEA